MIVRKQVPANLALKSVDPHASRQLFGCQSRLQKWTVTL